MPLFFSIFEAIANKSEAFLLRIFGLSPPSVEPAPLSERCRCTFRIVIGFNNKVIKQPPTADAITCEASELLGVPRALLPFGREPAFAVTLGISSRPEAVVILFHEQSAARRVNIYSHTFRFVFLGAKTRRSGRTSTAEPPLRLYNCHDSQGSGAPCDSTGLKMRPAMARTSHSLCRRDR